MAPPRIDLSYVQHVRAIVDEVEQTLPREADAVMVVERRGTTRAARRVILAGTEFTVPTGTPYVVQGVGRREAGGRLTFPEFFFAFRKDVVSEVDKKRPILANQGFGKRDFLYCFEKPHRSHPFFRFAAPPAADTLRSGWCRGKAVGEKPLCETMAPQRAFLLHGSTEDFRGACGLQPDDGWLASGIQFVFVDQIHFVADRGEAYPHTLARMVFKGRVPKAGLLIPLSWSMETDVWGNYTEAVDAGSKAASAAGNRTGNALPTAEHFARQLDGRAARGARSTWGGRAADPGTGTGVTRAKAY